MDAKLALARAIVARSHGEEAAARAEEHFTRVVREGQAPEDVPEVALPDGRSRAPAGPAGVRLRALDERGAAADRPGRRESGRRRRSRSWTCRARSSPAAALQAGKRRFAKLRVNRLTGGWALLLFLGCP